MSRDWLVGGYVVNHERERGVGGTISDIQVVPNAAAMVGGGNVSHGPVDPIDSDANQGCWKTSWCVCTHLEEHWGSVAAYLDLLINPGAEVW